MRLLLLLFLSSVVDSLFIAPIVCVGTVFCPCFVMQYKVLSRFAINLMGKRELVASLLLSFCCLVTVSVLCLFVTVAWVGQQCVIVVLPDHTHSVFLRPILFP